VALFEIVIALLIAGALFSALARRLNLPYPALLALAGAGLALLPNVPSVTLDPQLALTLFVAPVLLDAAYDASPRDLKENWRSVTSLAVGAVIFTVAAVALVARWAQPGLAWASAIALGAIVAPPDAAAATAVLKQLRPPHRMLVVLEGESLFNDASALLIYRLAVAAAAAGSSFSGWRAAPVLLLVVAGSVVLGAVLSRLVASIAHWVTDVSNAILVQFLSTFLVWMLAERLHLSGIITLVTFAILVARTTPASTPARLRVPSYAVWDLAVFVLNVLAFILVGLQLKPILQSLNHDQLVSYLATSGAICATVILVRIVWVMGHTVIGHLARQQRALPLRRAPLLPGLRMAMASAWCGMRGIVTLAAALALPADFPHRDLVLFASFSVVLGTLVVQGVTLSPLMRLLRLEDDGAVDHEVHRARAETARAALLAIDDGAPAPSRHEMVRLLGKKYEARLHRADHADPAHAAENPEHDGANAYLDSLRRAQAAERRTLFDLRARGVIGDDAFHRVEEELDLAELNAEAMARQA
jgi:monovalent cation/hydrogen antiporter